MTDHGGQNLPPRSGSGWQPSYGPPPGQPYGNPPPPYWNPPQGPPPGGFSPYGPPPRGRSKVPWVLGGAVVGVVGVVGVVAVVLVLVLADGGSKKNGPAAAVDTMLNADVHDDVAGERAAACGDLLETLERHIEGQHDAGLKSYQVGKVIEHGNTAQVAAKMTYDGTGGTGHPPAGAYPVLFTTEKQQDGTWKVCTVKPSRDDSSDSPSLGSAGR